jgi:hypothetical protein
MTEHDCCDCYVSQWPSLVRINSSSKTEGDTFCLLAEETSQEELLIRAGMQRRLVLKEFASWLPYRATSHSKSKREEFPAG